jgi:hypothetical protein
MASTRNKNTLGDYNLEQSEFKHSEKYKLYSNSQYGSAYHTNLPGNGLLPGQIDCRNLSNNYSDIESFLFGINSTNLVNPVGPLVPDLKHLKTVNIYKKPIIYLPEPLIVERNQRPSFT